VRGQERLGRAYLAQHRFEDAIVPLRTALARQPSSAEFRVYLSQALEGRARQLQAHGLGTEAESLLTESRALR
jgi:cytochrome c-type biogenesis protein CcmH/NrfG